MANQLKRDLRVPLSRYATQSTAVTLSINQLSSFAAEFSYCILCAYSAANKAG